MGFFKTRLIHPNANMRDPKANGRHPSLSPISDGFVLLWKKGKDIVAVGSQLINKEDNRVKLEETENGNTLVISLAEPSDAGEYMCQISASRPLELRHSVQIRGKV